MSKRKKYQKGYVQGYEDTVKTEMMYKEKKQELLLGLVPVANKGQELIPHKDYEIKQDGEKFYLVKKKKEYPKTYEECCEVLGINSENFLSIRNVHRYDGEEETIKYERDLLDKFDYLWQLIICRDAYWKVAGDEMGLGKPWEPDCKNERYSIYRYKNNKIVKGVDVARCIYRHILEFPTEEMRDAFYENFKKLIESCKELL